MTYFNPHPRMGDERLALFSSKPSETFQPTPLQWGELPFVVACVGNPKFQPTPPYGDERVHVGSLTCLVWTFQPTPPYGDEQQKESIVLTTSND